MLKNESIINKNSLFVIENVEVNVREIGKWLGYLSKQYTTFNCRVLLLCQKGVTLNDASWAEMLLQQGRDTLYPSFFNRNGQFLVLKPLELENITNIMTSYASYVTTIPLSEEILSKLVEQFLKVDYYRRPLYAILVIDTWLHNLNTFDWDKDKILSSIVDRREDILVKKCETYFPGINIEQINSLLNLVAIANIIGGLNIEKSGEFFEDYEIISKFANPLRVISILNISNDLFEIEIFKPLIEGVYFVLRRLIKDYYINKTKWKNVLSYIWNHYPQQATFFYNVMFCEFSYILYNHTDAVEALIVTGDMSINDSAYYKTSLLSAIPFYCSGKISRYAISEIKQIFQKYINDMPIMVLYVKAVVNDVMNMDNPAIISEMWEIKKVVENSGYQDKLLILYTEALVNLLLSYKEEFIDFGYRELIDIYHSFNEQKLMVVVSKGLYNVLTHKVFTNYAEIIELLTKLTYEYPKNDEIKFELAKSYYCILNEYCRIIEFGKNMASMASGEKDKVNYNVSQRCSGPVIDCINEEVIGEYISEQGGAGILQSMSNPNPELSSHLIDSVKSKEEEYINLKNNFFFKITNLVESIKDPKIIEHIINAGIRHWSKTVSDIKQYLDFIDKISFKEIEILQLPLLQAKAYLLSCLIYCDNESERYNTYKQLSNLMIKYPDNIDIQSYYTNGAVNYIKESEDSEAIWAELITVLKKNRLKTEYTKRFDDLYQVLSDYME